MFNKYLSFLLFIVFISSVEFGVAQTASNVPKNVIIMIGDGMGLSQVSSSIYFKDGRSNFERFKEIGLINTSSYSDRITDSAAGATAFSTGVRTYNGAIAVDSDSSCLETLFEKYGSTKSLGLVVTSSITHATPAAFYAHVDSRYKYEDIAMFLHKSPVDLVIGGGYQFFTERIDNRNYFDSLSANHFKIDTTGLPNTGKLDSQKKYAYLLAKDGMPRAQNRGDFLANATNHALSYLGQDNKGFMLLIEGSQIDWGGHDNDADYLIEEVLDFDRTIGIVLDFVDSNPGTLVVVTADHETGGFTLAADHAEGKEADYNTVSPTFSTTGHSASMVPVFAYGEGAEQFSGIYDNTEVYHKLVRLLGDSK